MMHSLPSLHVSVWVGDTIVVHRRSRRLRVTYVDKTPAGIRRVYTDAPKSDSMHYIDYCDLRAMYNAGQVSIQQAAR